MTQRKSAKNETPPPPRARAGRFVCAAGLLLGVLSFWAAFGFWSRMPIGRIRALRTEDYRAMYASVNRALGGAAYEGELHRYLSDILTESLTGRLTPEKLAEKMNLNSSPRDTSSLWRVQLATGRMRQLDGSTEDVWPAVHTWLEGLEKAHFNHRQGALSEVWALAYRNAGLDEGTAAEMGYSYVENPHGPFLEYFVGRMGELIERRRAAGDGAAADLCEKILLTLLRDWVLEAGPPGPRLLAAEKLAEFLGRAAPPVDGLDAAGIEALRNDLVQWRSSYVEALARQPIAVLSPRREPALTPMEHERLLRGAALVSWITAAAIAAGATALILTGVRIARRGANSAWRRAWLGAAVATLLVLAGGLAWIVLTPEAMRADFRSDFSSLQYTWRHPFIAGGAALLLTALAALLRRRDESGKDGFPARWKAGVWLLFCGLTVALLAGVLIGERARRGYERELRTAYDNPIVAVLGQDGEQRLDRLRQWTP